MRNGFYRTFHLEEVIMAMLAAAGANAATSDAAIAAMQSITDKQMMNSVLSAQMNANIQNTNSLNEDAKAVRL
jgi:hypothetical protein